MLLRGSHIGNKVWQLEIKGYRGSYFVIGFIMTRHFELCACCRKVMP